MSLKKHGLKALGLSILAALGLMAIIAPGASATETDFKINGSAAALTATATGEIDLLGVLLVPWVNLEIDCTAFVMEEGNLTTNTGHGQVKLLYEGCKAYAEAPLLWHKLCLIFPTAADRTAGTNEGKIAAKALLLALTHTGGVKIVKAEPVPPSTIFSKIFFKECTINSIDIKGDVDLSLHLGGNQVKHLVREVSVGLSQLEYGVNSAFLDGSVWVKLTGAHTGLSWGIL